MLEHFSKPFGNIHTENMKPIWITLLLLTASHKVSLANAQRNRSRKAIRDESEEVLSCDDGWYPFGDMCYLLGAPKRTGFQTWEKARDTCRAHKGNLASIHSKELQDYLQIFLQQKVKSHVWIGLNDHKTEGVWEWEDGSPRDFEYWDDNEPNLKTHEEDCVMMYYEGPHRRKEYGVWHDWGCDGDCSFICQKKKRRRHALHPDPRLCPDGGWQHEASCFHLVRTPMSWSEAEEYCVNFHQGHLATILDDATNRFITFVFISKVEVAWMGIKINSEVFQQKWSSGWFVSYEKWGDNEQPLQCSAFVSSGNWTTYSCTRTLPFICEVSSVSPPSMAPGPEGSHCPKIPAGWRDLGGEKCYFIEKENFISWQEANFRCLRMGGVLASIHSQNESNVLQYFTRGAKRSVYIGLHRSTLHEEDFAWSDGSPMDFTNWNDNEPNYSGEQCGEAVYNFRWNDITCTEGRGYICSVKKIVEEEPIQEKISCMNGFSLVALLGAMFCVLCACILVGLLLFYYRPCEKRQVPEDNEKENQYEDMELKC